MNHQFSFTDLFRTSYQWLRSRTERHLFYFTAFIEAAIFFTAYIPMSIQNSQYPTVYPTIHPLSASINIIRYTVVMILIFLCTASYQFVVLRHIRHHFKKPTRLSEFFKGFTPPYFARLLAIFAFQIAIAFVFTAVMLFFVMLFIVMFLGRVFTVLICLSFAVIFLILISMVVCILLNYSMAPLLLFDQIHHQSYTSIRDTLKQSRLLIYGYRKYYFIIGLVYGIIGSIPIIGVIFFPLYLIMNTFFYLRLQQQKA